jgi:hypothetical protein
VHRLNTFYRSLGGVERAETLHRPPPPPYSSVILLYDVVQVLDPPQLAIKWQDFLVDRGGESLRVGGVLVRADRERKPPVVGPHQLLKEAFCRGNITFRAEHELYGAARSVNRPVEVLPLSAHLHVRLVNTVGGTAHP